jgi:hypothetical protein
VVTEESREGFPSDDGVRVWGMRPRIVVAVTADRLDAIAANRNSPQKHVWRDPAVQFWEGNTGRTAAENDLVPGWLTRGRTFTV